MIQKVDTSKQVISRVDTLFLEKIDPEITNQYLSILSDTNAQLNSSYTPLVVSITILTALIGLGAIAAGYFIWRQGKDFKDRQNEILAEFKGSQNQYKESVMTLETLKNNYSEFISELQEKFKNLGESGSFTPEQTTTIETTIKETSEKFKQITQGEVICSGCGFKYNIDIPFNFAKGRNKFEFSLPRMTTCPQCGHSEPTNSRNNKFTSQSLS